LKVLRKFSSFVIPVKTVIQKCAYAGFRLSPE
jgi:hypothetical protein